MPPSHGPSGGLLRPAATCVMDTEPDGFYRSRRHPLSAPCPATGNHGEDLLAWLIAERTWRPLVPLFEGEFEW
jgi:hypothetical protein